MKTVVVTGATGFIGSHTCKAFKQAGYRVIGIDRAVTIPQATKFIDTFVKEDFVNTTADVAIKEHAVAVVHIAATSLVGPSITNPGLYYDNNVSKTNLMLEQLSKQGWTGTVVFSSSAAIYGNYCTVPIVESASSPPVSPYGHSKLMCEHVIADHCHANKNIKAIALRYFNACGCDADEDLGNIWNDTHLIPRIIESIITKKQLVINGKNFNTKDGTCVRDYLHVSDIASAHVAAVDLAAKMLPAAFEAYNLGTGTGYSNLELVENCVRVTKQELDVCYGNARTGDPDELVAAPHKFMAATNWQPVNSSLENIITTTYHWMRTWQASSVMSDNS